MVNRRLDVRLDEEHRQKLAALAKERQTTISDMVRKLIDQAFQSEMKERRLQLVREIAALELEDVPDPDELKRQLTEARYPGDIH